jgi:hypothetical protein
MQRFLDRSALYISAISSPYIVITCCALGIITIQAATIGQFLVWASTFIILGLLLPIGFILYGVKSGRYTDMHLMVREQRSEPFIIALVSTLLVMGGFYMENAPRSLLIMTALMFVNGFIFWFITQFWKISIHAASLTGAIMLVALLIHPYFFVLLLSVPLVMWARIRRQRHTAWQTVLAVIVVITITLSTYYLGIKFGS